MKNTEHCRTSNTEMVTISRAEYEELQAQSRRVSALEQRVDMLLEALRLARQKRFGSSSEKSDESVAEQLSFLFNEAEVFSQDRKKKLQSWPRTSAAKSTSTRWTAFRKAFPPR